jgi:hypothetical protein
MWAACRTLSPSPPSKGPSLPAPLSLVNEGVPGSSPGVGLHESSASAPFALSWSPAASRRTTRSSRPTLELRGRSGVLRRPGSVRAAADPQPRLEFRFAVELLATPDEERLSGERSHPRTCRIPDRDRERARDGSHDHILGDAAAGVGSSRARKPPPLPRRETLSLLALPTFGLHVLAIDESHGRGCDAWPPTCQADWPNQYAVASRGGWSSQSWIDRPWARDAATPRAQPSCRGTGSRFRRTYV